jgi:hypothetical protein
MTRSALLAGCVLALATLLVPAGGAPAANGCERVPPSGGIGPNVYAQSTTHSATSWSWSASSAGEPFHWYLFQGTTIKAHARSEGNAGSTDLPAGTYYWKVQNLGSHAQAWTVCWSSV